MVIRHWPFSYKRRTIEHNELCVLVLLQLCLSEKRRKKKNPSITSIAQHLLVVLFIILYKEALTFEYADEILRRDHSSDSRAIEYYLVVLFIMLYKEVLTFASVDEILTRDWLN